MKNLRNIFSYEYFPFTLMLFVSLGFLPLAFIINRPETVLNGFIRIIQSRSILVTDYIALGGIGATFLNVSMVGISTVMMLFRLGVKPAGANIMALWMSIGFAFFGKNVFNMIPLTFGVWLFSKYRKEPFSNYYLSALLVATISPTISEIAFLGMFSRPIEISAGVLMGFLVGFIFPAISADSVKIHSGFNLYNMGFAGGLVATMLATVYRNIGIDIYPANIWSSGNNPLFAGLLFSLSFILFVIGFFPDPASKFTKASIKKNRFGFISLHKHSGRLVTDFYQMYGNSVYINMAILCSFATTMVLFLGAELSGPVIAGILTIMGFGSLGKHLRNVVPVIIGAVASAYVNKYDPAAGLNVVAILFSTGLAPIAGKFGWFWGIVAGFLHVNIAIYIGDLNAGMNLYNNGFAASFVAMFLLPLITVFKKDSYYNKNKYR